MKPPRDGRRRVVIENVTPRVDDGSFPAKRIVGDVVAVEADVFADGHDRVATALRYRRVTRPPSKYGTLGRIITAPVVGCTDTSTACPLRSRNSLTTSAGSVTASELPTCTSFRSMF